MDRRRDKTASLTDELLIRSCVEGDEMPIYSQSLCCRQGEEGGIITRSHDDCSELEYYEEFGNLVDGFTGLE